MRTELQKCGHRLTYAQLQIFPVNGITTLPKGTMVPVGMFLLLLQLGFQNYDKCTTKIDDKPEISTFYKSNGLQHGNRLYD